MIQEVRNMKYEFRNAEKGQVLIIVILVIVVSLTIVLSLASRSIVNVRTSTEEAESQKALAAAEAGIEKALQDLTLESNIPVGDDATFKTDVVEVMTSGHLMSLNGGSIVPQGEGADVWFADHDSNGNINYGSIAPSSSLVVFWGEGNEINCNDGSLSTWPAAIEVIYVWATDTSGNPNTIRTTRYAYDYCVSRRSSNSFAEPFTNTGSSSIGLFYTPKILANRAIFARIIPIYKSTKITVEAFNRDNALNPVAIPSQGHDITSTGTSGQSQRKIKVFKGHPQLYLPYLSYGLFVP